MKQRLIYIDIARALCIVLVVIGHYMPEEHPAWWGALHDVIYSFHMPLFIFLSGFLYVLTMRGESYFSFLWRKFRRLMIPYFVTSVIVISIKLVTQGSMNVENPVNYMSYLKMFWSPEAGFFLWFIWALWWMFVIVPLFKNKYARLGLLVIAIVLRYAHVSLPEIFCLQQFGNMLVFFMLGAACCDCPKIKDEVTKYHPVKTISSIALFSVTQLVTITLGGGNSGHCFRTSEYGSCLSRQNG